MSAGLTYPGPEQGPGHRIRQSQAQPRHRPGRGCGKLLQDPKSLGSRAAAPAATTRCQAAQLWMPCCLLSKQLLLPRERVNPASLPSTRVPGKGGLALRASGSCGELPSTTVQEMRQQLPETPAGPPSAKKGVPRQKQASKLQASGLGENELRSPFPVHRNLAPGTACSLPPRQASGSASTWPSQVNLRNTSSTGGLLKCIPRPGALQASGLSQRVFLPALCNAKPRDAQGAGSPPPPPPPQTLGTADLPG